MKCCREFPEGQTRFTRYFKRSWYNHLKRLYRDGYALKRQGLEVELDNAAHVTEISEHDDFLDRMRGKYEAISMRLSPDARKLLEALLDPIPQPVAVEYAWREYCRKAKLRSLDLPVSGGKKFRIRIRHIRRALGLTGQRVREVVQEVKSVNRSQIRRK